MTTINLIKLLINITLTIGCIWWVVEEQNFWSISMLVLNISSLFLRGVLIGVDIQK